MARDILLLFIALDSSQNESIYLRAEMLLDLYGNLKIRESTRTDLAQNCASLMRIVASDPVKESSAQMLDLSHLKYSDRDKLEAVFTSWATPVRDKSFLSNCWEVRMRRDLQTRYDTRIGAFDWDFTMTLRELGADLITSALYFQWREDGVAFRFGEEASYVNPNPTMVSDLSVYKRDTTSHLPGYWGDMLIGPYVAFGLGEDALKYRKKLNDVDMQPSSEISRTVLMDYLQMIADGSKFLRCSVESPATITEISDVTAGNPEQKDETLTENYRISFLSPGSFQKICEREKYRDMFDVIYIGGHGSLTSPKELKKIVRSTGAVIFEAPRMLIALQKNRCSIYYQHFSRKMIDEGFSEIGKYHEKKDDYFVYGLS